MGLQDQGRENAPIELTGATEDDCIDTPSADWGATMDQFYAGKYAEILDDFDIAKADLKPDHMTKLDSIVTKMKANVALKAQLGGAADLTGNAKFNMALSLKRAQAARDYLAGKGIDACAAGGPELRRRLGAHRGRARRERGQEPAGPDLAAPLIGCARCWRRPCSPAAAAAAR